MTNRTQTAELVSTFLAICAPDYGKDNDVVSCSRADGRIIAAEIVRLRMALTERDALLAQMTEAIESIPYGAYSEALGEGCGADGAWGCFVGDCEDHFRPFLSADTVNRAIEQWRQMREIVAELASMLPARDYGTVPVPVALAERARRALGQTEGEG